MKSEGQKKGKEWTMEYSFDPKSISRRQSQLEFIYRTSIKNGTITDYDTVKHKGVNYSIGDFMEIYDVTRKSPYVARLNRIVKVPVSMEKFPFIQVQWCIKKNQLPKQILIQYGKHISEAEVFPAEDLKFCIYIDSIKCKCFVLNQEEYSKMFATYEYYYFTRANYSHEQQALIPSPENWKKQCVCQMPVNPDLVYVQCGECQKWFHNECTHIIDFDKTYVCASCENRGILNKTQN